MIGADKNLIGGMRMTEQIKNGYIDINIEDNPKEFETIIKAINSLKAWEEVIEELENATVKDIDSNFADAYGIGKGIQYAIEIINQHLAEIEEVR